ncbi:MAG: D-alanine--D-alanine ligase [Patescibacteria group bacterium]
MRVGVLRGGPGCEYEVSLRTGQAVLKHLSADKYKARDILIDKAGQWHLGGLPTTPTRAAQQVDVFFNALHGEFGEDGQVQSILEELSVPYTGSGVTPSILGMNKHQAKEIFQRAGLRVPPGLTIILTTETPAASIANEVFQKISPPWIVKPADRGSSVGVFFARTVAALAAALESARPYSKTFLVEHCLRGREATCGVVDNFRGRDFYPLPPIEIRRPAGTAVWTYDDKYNGQTAEICPGNFSAAIKKQIEDLSITAHRALGLRHYSRSDFIVTPYGIYILETNSLPGLTSESLLPKALAAVGCPYADFLDHVIKLAVERQN